MAITVSQLNVYPVKGLKGIAVESSAATERGLAHDRRFMVVDRRRADFLSQRELPRMATVWTDIAGGELRLAAPDHDEVAVPLEPADGEPLVATVWDSECGAIAPSPEADRWLSGGPRAALPARLHAGVDPAPVQPAPRRPGPAGRLRRRLCVPRGLRGLARATLNARLARPVPMDRFRANIVVTGLRALRRGRLGRVRGGRARRCAWPSPAAAARSPRPTSPPGEVTGPEPLATLSAWRVTPGVRGALRHERGDR